eukprot:TRINITY_DN2092_c0_g1_i3.p1 TRINITY_DN2092_c0_g1~~TRINITY_DN2092_c0_g1_i3.p1  ORF type:complete len:315 (+),score=94.74 TRINITY_DN2092_c0_g1_i3:357-1301(+)
MSHHFSPLAHCYPLSTLSPAPVLLLRRGSLRWKLLKKQWKNKKKKSKNRRRKNETNKKKKKQTEKEDERRMDGGVMSGERVLTWVQDVLELWRSPRLMNCALVFKEGSTVVVRDKKMLPMDFGSPLLQMVANNQRAFSLPEDLEFTYQYSESAQDAHTAQMRPLHTQSSLSEQDVSCDGVLLCFPVSKLLSSPEGSFENPQIRGWLWKRSYKRDRVSTKQKRFFVLNGSFLYYYKKERDALASGVIPLEYYVANVKKVEKKFSFLLTKSFDGFRGMTTQYKLQAETRDLLDIWLELIKKQCVNSGNKKSVWSGS